MFFKHKYEVATDNNATAPVVASTGSNEFLDEFKTPVAVPLTKIAIAKSKA